MDGRIRRVSLLMRVFIFQVFSHSASFHGCFAAAGHGHGQRHPTNINCFGSSVFLQVSGNVYPLGYYYVTVKIGNPVKPYQLDIDTGSDLTWVQCDAPCSGCNLPRDRLYKPSGKSYLTCKDPLCAAINSAKRDNCKIPNEKCEFQVEYADHGSVTGLMVMDNFPLRLVNGSISSPRLAFGCGNNLKFRGPHLPPATAGVLGLGRSIASISSQLSAMKIIQNVVGHCFSGQGGGFLFLGADFVPKSGITWTPMLHSSIDNHYSAGPADLLFGGRPTGMKGLNVMFDTGSTYTYLNSRVYKTVLDLIRKDLSGKPVTAVKDAALPVCWKGPKPFKSVSEAKAHFNTFMLSFTGTSNNQLKLPPEAYLIVTERGNACLGILDGSTAGLGATNIIGDISLVDKMVIYDNVNQRIGWAYADCNQKRG